MPIMKTVIIFLLFFVSPLLSLDFNFTLERIDVDFNGVTYCDKTVVIYGTGSIILFTSDSGKTWSQKNIHHDTLDIRQMIFKNNRYIGILNKYYIVTGTPDAKNWQSHFVGNIYPVSLTADENNIFVLADNSIYIFDNNFSFKQKLTIKDTNKFTEIKIFVDKLIAAGEKGKMLSIDLNNYTQEIIDFEELGICKNCPRLLRPIVDNKSIYIQLGSDVYKSDDLQNWVLKAKKISLYNVKNDIIFDLSTKNYKKLVAASVVFRKFSNITGDTLNKNWKQRNTGVLKFTDYKFLNEKTVVAVGFDKLLLLSNDGGINWNLISQYTGGFSKCLKDTTIIYIGSKGKIYKSTNKGVTWLPPFYTDTLVSRLQKPRLSYFDNQGYGFVLYYVKSDDYDNLLVTYDSCNTYQLRYNKLLNLIRTAGQHTLIKKNTGFNIIIPTGEKNYMYTSILELDTALHSIHEQTIDSIHILCSKRLNDNKYIAIAKNLQWPYFLSSETNDSSLYQILYSYNNGLTWEKDFNLHMKDTTLKPVMNIFNNKILVGGVHWHKESATPPNINQLYLINLDLKNRIRIFNDNVSNYTNVTKYNKFLFIGGWECILVNTNFNENPLIWSKIYVKNKYILGIYNIKNELWMNIMDNTTHKKHIYRVKTFTSTLVSQQIETNTYLYSNLPYPNPAKSIVNVEVFWDQYDNLTEADLSLYDYLGNKINFHKEIILSIKNSYSGILTWDCTKYDNGLYFIVIKHGDATRSIPVVVSR
jgi:hypothetical protein